MDHNQEENRCENREINEAPTVTDCIENYVHTELGCNVPWHINKDSRKQDCSSDYEFQRYQTLATQLSLMSDRKMEQDTGCIRRCQRMEYKLWETSPIGSKTKYPPELVKLSFVISSAKYEKKEHYFIYDGDTLIADIGGYCSLLLGFSILSIFKSFLESTARLSPKKLFNCESAFEGCSRTNELPKVAKNNAQQFQKGNLGLVVPI